MTFVAKNLPENLASSEKDEWLAFCGYIKTEPLLPYLPSWTAVSKDIISGERPFLDSCSTEELDVRLAVMGLKRRMFPCHRCGVNKRWVIYGTEPDMPEGGRK